MKNPNQRGVALIAVLVVLSILMALCAGIVIKSRIDVQMTGALGQTITGFFAAESGLSQGMGEFKTKFLNYSIPVGTDFSPRTSTISGRLVSYQLTEKIGNPKDIIIPAGQLFAGLHSLEYGYTVTSKATNTARSDDEASVGAEFLVGNIPLFQFVAFYANDLEILPGANMNLTGRVHTNGNLYLNTDANPNTQTNGRASGLYIEDWPAQGVTSVQVTAKNNIYRGRKNNGSCNGLVTIDKLEDKVAPVGDLDPAALDCINGASNIVPTATLTGWKGSIVNAVDSINPPTPDIFHRGAGNTYWDKADLRIALMVGTQGSLPLPTAAQITACPNRTAGFTHGTAPTLANSIQVLNADQTVNAAKTALLYDFMTSLQANGVYCNGAASSATGTMLGTRPIFYTDVPVTNNNTVTGAPQCTCSDANYTNCTNTSVNCYPQVPTTRGIGWRQGFVPNPTPTPTWGPMLTSANESLDKVPYRRTYTNYSTSGGVTPSGQYCNGAWGTGACTQPGMLGDLDYRRGGFYNIREHKWMLLLNVNVGDLLRWNAAQPAGSQLFDPADSTDGGVVLFLTVVGPLSGGINNYGMRIFGSRNLPFPIAPGVGADPTGITIVSDQAGYIQGDLNIGTANGAPVFVPASLPKQPVAVMADSINVLSNNYFANDRNWANDSQSNRDLGDSGRAGNGVWINAGLIGGVDNTVGGNYNGGLENYPRFHESWGGTTLNYWGSFVSLGTPEHVNGGWCGTGGGSGSGCNIYNPPLRQYNYDYFFNNVANLPPLTPRFVYVQQVLFTEDFK